MARVGYDNFTSIAASFVTAATVVADMPLADAILSQWIKGALMNYERGYFRYTIHNVFPLLYDLKLLQMPSEIRGSIALVCSLPNMVYTDKIATQLE